VKILVTGSGSHLAAALLPKLCARRDVERVTGVDRGPPRFRHARFETTQIDIRSPQVEDLLGGHDVLVHLAWVKQQGDLSDREMFDINVNGGHKVFHAARRAGVRRFVLVSSAAVYGSGVHLSEAAPLEPLPQLLYARHQAHLEQLLHIEFPDCVRFRPHLILGPNASPSLKRLLQLPCYVHTPAPYPLLQCVHEDDAAQAILLALDREVRGPFNLAVEDNFTLREVVRRRHRLALPLPPFAARVGLSVARRWLGLGGELAWIEGLTRTLLVNCRRAAVELGWRSTHSAASVLAHT
jgi:nucleoside-diphosphate-sugar epimerase